MNYFRKNRCHYRARYQQDLLVLNDEFETPKHVLRTPIETASVLRGLTAMRCCTSTKRGLCSTNNSTFVSPHFFLHNNFDHSKLWFLGEVSCFAIYGQGTVQNQSLSIFIELCGSNNDRRQARGGLGFMSPQQLQP